MKKIRLSPINGLPLENSNNETLLDYTKSAIYDGEANTLTIKNVENGIEQNPQSIFISHRAISQYTVNDPFDISVGFSYYWMKFLITDDLSTYTLFFQHPYENKQLPIRVLTDWDLFNDNNINCVKITANEDSVFTRFNVGDNNPNLQYSSNGVVWNDYIGQISIKKGSSILLRGDNPDGFNTDTNKYTNIELLGDVSLSGNIMGLLDNGTGSILAIPSNGCFTNLFLNSTGITSVSKNFLPATILTPTCYSYMFNGCTNLRNAPKLPATTVYNSGYSWMFNGCISLKEAPDLPATTLEQYCYNRMFRNCISLVKAPTLPATTLVTACYKNMFEGCSSLFSVKIAYTGNFADITDAFGVWLSGVPSYGIIYYNGSDTTTGASAIPTGWQKITF